MANILGLNLFHPDSAACGVSEGELVVAVAEERLGKRFKHVATFPAMAIAKTLSMAGFRVEQTEAILTSWRWGLCYAQTSIIVARAPFS